MANQIDHHLAAHQGSAPPVLRNVAKHAVLDLVPLAGPRRKVTHRNPQPDIIGQLLQLHLPQAVAAPVGTAPIGGDQQTLRTRIDSAAHVVPPSPDRFHGELGCVVIDSNAAPARVSRHIIDPVGNDLAQLLVGKVVDLYWLGLAFRGPLPATITELTDQFLLLGIDRHDRLPLPLEDRHPPVDVLTLRIAVRVMAAFKRLAVGLQAVAQVVEEPVDAAFTDSMALVLECRCQPGCALARPAQWPHGVPTCHWINQRLKGLEETWVMLHQGPSAPARTTYPLAGR